MKPREFWIRDFRFGDNENCSQECTVDLINHSGAGWTHVRGVNPAFDQAVALLYDACRRKMDSDKMCDMPFNEDIGAAIEAYEKAIR